MYHITELQLECERVLRSSVSLETYPLLADLAEKYNSATIEQVSETVALCTQSTVLPMRFAQNAVH